MAQWIPTDLLHRQEFRYYSRFTSMWLQQHQMSEEKCVTFDSPSSANLLSFSADSHLGLDYHQSFLDHCPSAHCGIRSLPVRRSGSLPRENELSFRRAKFEAELRAMQWLIKWEELTTRTLLHNSVATPSFNKLSSSQKVSFAFVKAFRHLIVG